MSYTDNDETFRYHHISTPSRAGSAADNFTDYRGTTAVRLLSGGDSLTVRYEKRAGGWVVEDRKLARTRPGERVYAQVHQTRDEAMTSAKSILMGA